MTYLKCPNCSMPLIKHERTYQCIHKHTFDCARSGYVNLHQAQNAKQHGDEASMLNARKAFLDKGYYHSLVESLRTLIQKESVQAVLDAGCGEGWYCQHLQGDYDVVGIDISKQACDLAAKRNKSMTFAVGSTFAMPILDETMDVVYSVFAPFKISEVSRVLKETGRFIHVFPLENHLLGLKEAIYDKAYLNDAQMELFEGMHLIEENTVYGDIKLSSNEDIRNLFAMTPYIHRTSKKELDRLEQLTHLKTEIAFGLNVYKKNK